MDVHMLQIWKCAGSIGSTAAASSFLTDAFSSLNYACDADLVSFEVLEAWLKYSQ